MRANETTELTAYIIASLTKYIRNNFPGTENPSEVIGDFVEILLQDRIDWKVADVDLFVMFMRRNPHLLKECGHVGYTMTERVLTAMAGQYDMHRSDHRETMVKENVDLIEKIVPDQKGVELAKQILEKLNGDKKGIKSFGQIKRESFEKYELRLIATLPGKSKDELIDAFRVLEIHFSVGENEGKKQIYFHFNKAMREIAQILIDRYKYKIEFNKPKP